MTTFVLVHGWWLGGWSWDGVAACLEDAGHEVFTPALLGCGERAAELRPGLDLEAQVSDLTAALRVLKVREAVVVGHDFGAMVATGAIARAPECARELVYVDGLVAEDGQSALDVLPSLRPWFAELALRVGSGWRIPPPTPAELGLGEAREGGPAAGEGRGGQPPSSRSRTRLPADRVSPRLTSIAWSTQDSPLHLHSELQTPRAYVRCTGWPRAGRLALGAQLSGWPVVDLEAGHAAMITAARQLAEALQRLAGTRRRVVDLRERDARATGGARPLRVPPDLVAESSVRPPRRTLS